MRKYNKILAKVYLKGCRLWVHPFGLKLSNRTTHCLVSTDAKSLEEVLNYTEEELLKYKNLGKKVLEEIKQELDKIGLKLKEET